MRRLYVVGILSILGAGLTGCVNQKVLDQRDLEIASRDQQITELRQEIGRLEHEASSERDRAGELGSDLHAALGDLQNKEKLWLEQKEGMSTITMPNTATFASGSDELSDEGKEIIDTVWQVLARYPDREILIEGHTDNVAIAGNLTSRFATNWELSAARALAVLHYVSDTHQTVEGRLAAVGCGEYRPVSDNSTKKGRTRNRRVVIVVGPTSG